MSLWKPNKEHLNKRIGAKDEIKKSGVYDVTIEHASLLRGAKAQGVKLRITSDAGYKDTTLWYVNSKGEQQEWIQTLLNRLLYLAKTDVSRATIVIRNHTFQDGNTKEIEYIQELENLKIGIILDIGKGKNKEGKEVEYVNVKDFYDIKRRLTADEIISGQSRGAVAEFEEKYNKNKQEVEKEEDTTDEEFPF